MKFNQQKLAPYLFISPFVILFAIFGIFPIFYSIYISLFEWSIGGPEKFVGFQNYLRFLTYDPFFLKSLGNTVLLLFMGSLTQHLFALPIAILLNGQFVKGKSIFKVGYFIPYVTSAVVISLIFWNLFEDNTGFVNYLLKNVFGLEPVRWLKSAFPMKTAISVVLNWKYIGFYIIVYLAGLQSVDKELYEAARIDGASKFQQNIHITLPLLVPVIFFALSISIIYGLQLYDEAYVMSGNALNQIGGVDNSGLTMTYYLMYLGFRLASFGRASAVSWLMFAVIMVFTLGNKFITDRFDYSKASKKKKAF